MFYLFRTNTTGLIKPKKSRPFNTEEDCIDAGKALNILDGTPDRVFLCIPAAALQCRTNITDPLPFSESFFRLPRLSDSNSKFAALTPSKQSFSATDVDLQELSPENAMLYAGSQINMMHPALANESQIPPNSFFLNKQLHVILSNAGLTKNNMAPIQSQIQYELGLIPMHRSLTNEELTLVAILKKCFSNDLSRINTYISELVMSRGANFGKTETCNSIPFPQDHD